MLTDLKGEQYERLYLRYLNPAKLDAFGDAAGPLKGKVVLDLCCGRGRLSSWCLDHGAAFVEAIDKSERMMEGIRHAKNFAWKEGPIEKWLGGWMSPEQFDVAFCLQAINYWFCDETVGMVERVLRPGGLFVFNTFNVKPPETPVVKQYDMDGDSFVEVSWSVGDIVQHVQIRSGMEPHFNSFRWVSPDEFHATLGKYFSRVNEKVNGPSSLYVCHKVLDLSIIK